MEKKDGQTDRRKNKGTDRLTDWAIVRQREMDRQRYRQADRLSDRLKGTDRHRWIDSWMDQGRKTDEQTKIEGHR